MGQKNKVSVINFVAQGTIEHRMLSVLNFKSALAQGILDNGEDAIFMDSDKFTRFMKTVEAVAGVGDTPGEAVVPAEEEMEPVEMGTLFSHIPEDTESGADEIPVAEERPQAEDDDAGAGVYEDEEDDYFEGDDDIAPIETITSSYETAASPVDASISPARPEPQDLLAGGLRFLSGLAQTLSSPEATQRLVSSIVERDEATGRSYMKIPVDDQQTVVNVINMIGRLFSGKAD
jgi:hypothetical protein